MDEYVEAVGRVFNGEDSVYRAKDDVLLFGSVAGLFSVVSGIVLYGVLVQAEAELYARLIGPVWAVLGVLDFYALHVFERVDRRRGGRMLAIFGIAGFVVGAGFFVGSAMVLLAGMLAIKHSARRVGERVP